jgi:hypothetical protein
MIRLIFIGLLFFSCNQPSSPDFAKEKEAILELEAKQRTYHFTKNVKAFIDMFSKDFLSVNRGRVDKPTSKASYEMFDAYFKSVEFIRWDDNKEPVVRFSNDGSIAYVAVDKLVIVKVPGTNGKQIMDTTNYAWLTVYKKDNNDWKIDCVTSTNR